MQYRETAVQAQARIQAENADKELVQAEQAWHDAHNKWEAEAKSLPSHAESLELYAVWLQKLKALERANAICLRVGTISLVEEEAVA